MYNKSVFQRVSAGGKEFSSAHFTIVVAVILLSVATAFYLCKQTDQLGDLSVDWINAYHPAIRSLISGQSPYTAPLKLPVSNPPWILLLLTPLAVLPPDVGGSLLFALYLLSMGYVAYRLHAKPLHLAAFLLSFPVLGGAANGQVDFLVALGLFLPPQWGLILVLAKPQVGIAVAVYWCIEAYRSGGYRQVIETVAPVSGAFLLSFLVYGFWPAQAMQAQQYGAVFWNVSLAPWTVLPALVLMWLAINKRNITYAYPVSPMISPYLGIQSWFIALLPLVTSHYIFPLSAASWLLKFINFW